MILRLFSYAYQLLEFACLFPLPILKSNGFIFSYEVVLILYIFWVLTHQIYDLQVFLALNHI